VSAPIIFLDLGGVLVDKEQQITQWDRLVGDYFVSLLGGTKQGWIEAHHLVTRHMLEREGVERPASFARFYWNYQRDWIKF
jgi:hypothetical protein